MEPKHTKLGIASFLLSLVTETGLFALIAITALVSSARNVNLGTARLGQTIFALCLFALTCSNLIAVGLGIAGLAQSECKKLFAILGTGLALLALLFTIFLIAWIANN